MTPVVVSLNRCSVVCLLLTPFSDRQSTHIYIIPVKRSFLTHSSFPCLRLSGVSFFCLCSSVSLSLFLSPFNSCTPFHFFPFPFFLSMYPQSLSFSCQQHTHHTPAAATSLCPPPQREHAHHSNHLSPPSSALSLSAPPLPFNPSTIPKRRTSRSSHTHTHTPAQAQALLVCQTLITALSAIKTTMIAAAVVCLLSIPQPSTPRQQAHHTPSSTNRPPDNFSRLTNHDAAHAPRF